MFACRPDLAFHVAQLSQRKAEKATAGDVKRVNRTVADIKENAPMTVPPLDRGSLTVVGYFDAGFANNTDLTSQLGMSILLKDKYDNAMYYALLFMEMSSRYSL